MELHQKRLTACLSVLAIFSAGLVAAATHSEPTNSRSSLHVDRVGSLPSKAGPPEWFTGKVRIDMQFQRELPSRVAGAVVTFEPGARTAWHSHPLGQTLIVTFGKGWTQCGNGPVTEIAAGDIVWCPPGVRHWHGATATTAMSHIAIQEAIDGKTADWMDPVSDREYNLVR